MLSENGRAKKTTTGTTNGWRRETQTEVIYMYIYIYIHIIIQKKKSNVGHNCEPKHVAMDTRSNTC